MTTYTIDQLNRLDRSSFTEALGAVFEHSPWVAERAWPCRPFLGIHQLHRTMMSVVERASDEERLALIQAHPDLAGRLKLSELSAKEQKGAGLTDLTPEERESFLVANEKYTSKFGFPFIIAVKGRSKQLILEAMTMRITNDAEAEKRQALLEIGSITRFRLEVMIRNTHIGEWREESAR